MKFHPNHFLKMALTFLCIYLVAACSKDSDLLSDYVLNDTDSAFENLLIDDTYTINANQSTVLDVLSNDTFEEGSTVRIIKTSDPRFGTVTINEDNTLTYTPTTIENIDNEDGQQTDETTSDDESSSEATGESTVEDEATESSEESNDATQDGEAVANDSFTYTIEETTVEGETNTSEGNVTVNTNESSTPTTGENIYFVTVNGSANADGKTENTAWNWNHAVYKARPGMIIYVKAGEYNNYTTRLTIDGNQEEPIRFIGYKNTPGDIDAFKQSLLGDNTNGRRGTTRLADNIEFDFKSQPSSSDMPYFYKPFTKDDTAFHINSDFTEFHNFIVAGYATGMFISAESSNSKIINCIFYEQGNQNVDFYDSGHPDRYSGDGITIARAKDYQVLFCSLLNPEQQGIALKGTNTGIVENNVVYSYNLSNGVDYFILLTGESGNATNLNIRNNLVERLPDVAHPGHGFSMKNGANNNTVSHFKAINTSIEAEFGNVFNNTYTNGFIKGSFYETGDELSTINASNGAHGNTFKNIIVDNAWGGILMGDFDYSQHSDTGIDPFTSGVRNNFINIIVKNCKYAWLMADSVDPNSNGPIDNNFINCTFVDVEYVAHVTMKNSGNRFYNTTFNTTSGFADGYQGHSLNSNTIFENCHFNGSVSVASVNNFQSSNNIDGDPLFIDINSIQDGNFNVTGLRLQTVSPLKGTGIDISNMTNASMTNFLNESRANGINIGAF